jgi:hypothetical protein
MASQLENLVKIGKLKKEPPAKVELDGLVHSGRARLKDAGNTDLSLESRFDLAYNAAHALALAALRYHGYRPDNRYLAFQTLEHTLQMTRQQWRVLDKAHALRNLAEYEGQIEVEAEIVDATIRVTTELDARLRALGL